MERRVKLFVKCITLPDASTRNSRNANINMASYTCRSYWRLSERASYVVQILAFVIWMGILMLRQQTMHMQSSSPPMHRSILSVAQDIIYRKARG